MPVLGACTTTANTECAAAQKGESYVLQAYGEQKADPSSCDDIRKNLALHKAHHSAKRSLVQALCPAPNDIASQA